MPPVVRGSQTWRSFSPFYVPYVIWTFGTGYSLGPTLAELHLPDRMLIIFSSLPIILPVLLIFSLLMILGAIHLRKQNYLLFWSNTLWFLFPLIFAICGAILSPNEFNVRYTILSFPAFILLLIVGIKSIKYEWIRLFAFGTIILVSLFSLNNHFFNERYHKENNRAAGQFLTTHASSHDIVICTARYTYQMLSHYYKGNDIEITGYPVKTLYVKHDELEPDLERILAGRKRFWLFLSRTFHSDPEGSIKKYCDKKFRRAKEFKSNGIELFLYNKIYNLKS
jgi:hypothetical protein